MPKAKPFTMVEILIALGVCLIGICSLMVLFPVGANATRDVSAETYADTAANQMLRYWQYLIAESGWSNIEGALLPPLDDSTTPYPFPFRDPNPDLVNRPLASANPLDNLVNANLTDETERIFANINIVQHEDGQYELGLYRIISQRRNLNHNQPDDERPEDFRALVFVRWSHVKAETANTNVPYFKRLHVWVEWPENLPIANRQRAYCSLDICTPDSP